MIGPEGHLPHQFCPPVHVVGIIGRTHLIFGQVKDLVRIGLEIVRIDAGRGSVNNFLNICLSASAENHRVDGEVCRASRLVSIYVPSTTVVSSQMKHNLGPLRCSVGYAPLEKIALKESHCAAVEMALDVFQLAAA